MNPDTRSLLRITLPPEYEGRAAVKGLVDRLMGRAPAQRFMFIQNRAGKIDPELIDARLMHMNQGPCSQVQHC